MVFWTHTMAGRATGWLTPAFHALWREVMLHCCARHELVCPIYVLMPDHWHFVWCGVRADSDQLMATRFLRKHVADHLIGVQLQARAYDHVLRDRERAADRFEATFDYIRQNPVRKELCAEWGDWPYIGAVVAGYPNLEVRNEDHLPRFWRIYNGLVNSRDGCTETREQSSLLRAKPQ